MTQPTPAAGAKPVNAKLSPYVTEVWHGGQYVRRVIGKSAVIVMSDGTEVVCEHAHRSRDAGIACARAIVNRLSRAADTKEA